MKKNIVGNEIKKRREKLMLSYTQLSELLRDHCVTLSETEIEQIEQFTRPVYDIELIAICNALGCTPDDLFTEK